MKTTVHKELTTVWEERLNKTAPWQEYPRPQFKRSSYLNLNGIWSLSVAGKNGKIIYEGDIIVPFPPESHASGISLVPDRNNLLTYRKKFALPKGFTKDRILLHFDACDQETEVYIDGCFIGANIGGYLPFSFDITAHICSEESEHELTVIVKDTINEDLSYGKQRFKRGGMWYTPISGIWQTVWIESVPKNHIKSLKIDVTLESAVITVNGGCDYKKLTLLDVPESEKTVYEFSGDTVTVTLSDYVNWTPETPRLYNFKMESGDDCIESYFALRTIGTCIDINGIPRITLNGKPYFFHGVLDQGYFSDGIYLPSSPEGYLNDISSMKKLGFNMLRKHIKIEPELFYYYCDREGMIVFQDFVNSGRYSFLIDTALPTIGLKKGITHRASAVRRKEFEKTAAATVRRLYNSPCVCCYTVFNEGWGQYNAADMIYGEMKQLDGSRIWDTASGWFNNARSDVVSEHIYFKKLKLSEKKSNPVVFSEFGGYSCKIPEHSFNLKSTYGYKFFTDIKKFRTALSDLYLNEVLPLIKKGLCAAVLTQLSDVEDETNGLLTYDRKVLKIDTDEMKNISKMLKKEMN